ncbi:protein yihD [Klebsiella variicola]|uniref:Protein yihD n=1 Tax=Klebsiella variicola TaxID=244366 RepID=A0A7H4MAD8_KLEVA|nr:protein yihD [Klebsiella variicola]
MKCKRLNEVIELLQPAWQKEPELNLDAIFAETGERGWL